MAGASRDGLKVSSDKEERAQALQHGQLFQKPPFNKGNPYVETERSLNYNISSTCALDPRVLESLCDTLRVEMSSSGS